MSFLETDHQRFRYRYDPLSQSNDTTCALSSTHHKRGMTWGDCDELVLAIGTVHAEPPWARISSSNAAANR
jgi:hypothetical protein